MFRKQIEVEEEVDEEEEVEVVEGDRERDVGKIGYIYYRRS